VIITEADIGSDHTGAGDTVARDAARPRRPTIEDVAALAGVSRGTVSRVLNGGASVSPAALGAVRRAIQSTGYVVNHHARSLVTHRSQSVAFILSESQDRLFTDPNFGTLLRGCTQALAEHDLPLLLSVAGSEQDRRRVARFAAAGHVDGALLVSACYGDPVIGDLAGHGVPVVACGEQPGDSVPLAYVAADDRGGARQMVSYLRAAGCARIATITGPLNRPGGPQRLAGYRDVLGEVAPELIAHGDFSEESGAAAAAELLQRAPDLDGLFVASDLMARGAIRALARAGRRVPGDVRVGGFDDSSAAVTTDPPLTTIRQPWARISAEMTRLLLSQMAGEPPAAVILPTELVRRGSA
jgi:DNA-binding LacI/PurR family transcriptional regulator